MSIYSAFLSSRCLILNLKWDVWSVVHYFCWSQKAERKISLKKQIFSPKYCALKPLYTNTQWMKWFVSELNRRLRHCWKYHFSSFPYENSFKALVESKLFRIWITDVANDEWHSSSSFSKYQHIYKEMHLTVDLFMGSISENFAMKNEEFRQKYNASVTYWYRNMRSNAKLIIKLWKW